MGRVPRVAALSAMGLLVLLAACEQPIGIAACDRNNDPIAREECRYDAVKALVADDAALTEALAALPDDASRDLVRVRLAFDNTKHAQALCAPVKTPALKDKCDKVVGRPHIAGPPRPSP